MKKLDLSTTQVDKMAIQPAKDFLKLLGIDENDVVYAQALYNLRYSLYRAVVETFKIDNK